MTYEHLENDDHTLNHDKCGKLLTTKSTWVAFWMKRTALNPVEVKTRLFFWNIAIPAFRLFAVFSAVLGPTSLKFCSISAVKSLTEPRTFELTQVIHFFQNLQVWPFYMPLHRSSAGFSFSQSSIDCSPNFTVLLFNERWITLSVLKCMIFFSLTSN